MFSGSQEFHRCQLINWRQGCRAFHFAGHRGAFPASVSGIGELPDGRCAAPPDFQGSKVLACCFFAVLGDTS